ncbi:hypothetical protein IKG38_03950 [Candidatus Saccharibacteria bacterium]|nr:hypothetical protein [Candidatus Saccharibacteria bacterium]
MHNPNSISNTNEAPSESSTKWDTLKEVPGDFAKPSSDMTPEDHHKINEGVARQEKYTEYLKNKIHDLYEKGTEHVVEHGEELSDLHKELKSTNPVERTKERIMTREEAEASAAKQAEHEEYLKQDEEYQEKQEKILNQELYGESNISATEARQGFIKERSYLQTKQRKAERADERDKNLPLDQRDKAYKKRQKNGEIFTPEEAKRLRELDSIYSIDYPHGVEDYGRRKEAYFSSIQKTIANNKRGFKKWAKANNISIPTTWDDPNYSMAQLRNIAKSSEFLNE